MNGRKVEELQRAIGTVTQQELEELRLWLDDYAGPTPLDRPIKADLATGRLDRAVLASAHPGFFSLMRRRIVLPGRVKVPSSLLPSALRVMKPLGRSTVSVCLVLS